MSQKADLPPKKVTPPPSPPVQRKAPEETSDAAKRVEDLEKELELDLENVQLDDNIDTSVGGKISQFI